MLVILTKNSLVLLSAEKLKRFSYYKFLKTFYLCLGEITPKHLSLSRGGAVGSSSGS